MGGDATTADLGDEPLADDRGERHGELRAHLLLLIGGEHVDDPVDGLRRVVGVERREHEVTGLGEGERVRDRFEVAHLAHQHHVGVFAQCSAEGIAERHAVGADLALIDERHRRRVHVLDRVLDGEDVARPMLVDPTDHRRQRGRLARAGRTGHEHQAEGAHHQGAADIGQRQLLGRGDLGGDESQRQRRRTELCVGVGAKARPVVPREREVVLTHGFVRLATLVVEQPGHHRLDRRRLGGRLVGDGEQLAVDPHAGHRPGRHVKVGRLVVHQVFEPGVEQGGVRGGHGAPGGDRVPLHRQRAGGGVG